MRITSTRKILLRSIPLALFAFALIKLSLYSDNASSSEGASKAKAVVGGSATTLEASLSKTIAKNCTDNRSFRFRNDRNKDCHWISKRNHCNKRWENQTIATVWCPRSCGRCTNKKTNYDPKTILYIGLDKDEQRNAGLNGYCDNGCPIRGIGWKSLATIDWDTVRAFIVPSKFARSHPTVLDSLPSFPRFDLYSVLYWREAFWSHPNDTDKYDILMGTHFTDQILNPCHYPPNFQKVIEPDVKVLPFSKRPHLAVHISSNCQSNRQKFVAELQNHMDVQIHGKCATQNYTLSVPTSHKHPPMVKFLSNYKFYIAVENTSTKSYISEKLFLALGSGAIPVYLGASEASSSFPKLDGRTKWFIDARDFPTVKALADYLLDLASNETKFNEYLQWQNYAAAVSSQKRQINSNAFWMPKATENIRECLDLVYTLGKIESRHGTICKLCDPDYLEMAKQRPRVNPQNVPYPKKWGIPAT